MRFLILILFTILGLTGPVFAQTAGEPSHKVTYDTAKPSEKTKGDFTIVSNATATEWYVTDFEMGILSLEGYYACATIREKLSQVDLDDDGDLDNDFSGLKERICSENNAVVNNLVIDINNGSWFTNNPGKTLQQGLLELLQNAGLIPSGTIGTN
jgi:hypothetical protein